MKFGSAAGSSVLGAALLAAFALRGPATAPVIPQGMQSEIPATTQNAEASGGKSSSRTWPDEGPWQASRKHFSGIWPDGECPAYTHRGVEDKKLAPLNGGTPGPQSDRQGVLVSNPREEVWCIPKGEQVRAMIAIVPDPVHSHMALPFDRSVEAIQLAGQAMNYVIDRYWLPWEPVTAANGPPAQGKVDRGSQPGLLMFRWNADVDQSGESGKQVISGASLLYVFLVTDTSTAGINGDQSVRL